VALQVLKIIRKDNLSLKELAEVVGRDPALTAKVLRTANSSLYGLTGKIRTIHQATVALGVRTIRSLALSFTIVSTLRQIAGKQFDLTQFWTDSLTRAAAARKLAGHVAPGLADVVFAAAMLGHIGILALHRTAPEEYERVLWALGTRNKGLITCEKEILGFTHADLGAELAASWQLPAEFVLAIQYHEDLTDLPDDLDESTRETVRLTYWANLIARFLRSPDQSQALDAATVFADETWGLVEETLDLLLQSIHEDIHAAATVFEVSVEEMSSYHQILQMANLELAKIALQSLQPDTRVDESEFQALQQQRESLRRRAESLASLAYRDELTGALNLRGCTERLPYLFAEAQLAVEPLALVFCDLDGFKDVNDRFGHEAGNEVLRAVAERLSGQLRPADVLCRYGGDEFVILLPGTTLTDARSAAERIRLSVAGAAFRHSGGSARLTLSAGVAAHEAEQGYPDAQALLKAADRAMYLAKRAGKNHVAIAEPAPAQSANAAGEEQ
jgi:diguanylate cyclase (GGDEF)-like protein